MIPWMLQAHAVYLYDEKVLITFNYKDGTKTITFDEIAAKDAPEGNGSDLGCFAPPKQEPLTLVRGFFVASSTNPRQSRAVQGSNRAAAHSAVSKAPVGRLKVQRSFVIIKLKEGGHNDFAIFCHSIRYG